MGAFLDKPKTDKHTEVGSGNGLRYGVSCMQGWRVEMEDAHCATIGLPKLKDWSFFAVFDGHAGARVSAYSARRLLEVIVSCQDFHADLSPETIQSGIKTGFLKLDDEIRELPETVTGEDKSGSTAVCAMISPSHIFIANCGDSRIVLSRDSAVAFSTYDHKPVNPIEKERIQNAGGSVMIQRVNGSLAVSRALGDFDYKNVQGKGPCEQLVSPEPEISVMERTDNDEFLILACDGIWDVMSNEELCDFVRNRMQITDNLETICSSVVDTCLSKGSRDNMSIVIVAFSGGPKVSEEAKEKEMELDKQLETKIKEILTSHPPEGAIVSYVMHLLAIEDLEGLPPGGGLNAKSISNNKKMEQYSSVKYHNDVNDIPYNLLLASHCSAYMERLMVPADQYMTVSWQMKGEVEEAGRTLGIKLSSLCLFYHTMELDRESSLWEQIGYRAVHLTIVGGDQSCKYS